MAAIVVLGGGTSAELARIATRAAEAGCDVVIVSTELDAEELQRREREALESMSYTLSCCDSLDAYVDIDNQRREEHKQQQALYRADRRRERNIKRPKWGMNRPKVRY